MMRAKINMAEATRLTRLGRLSEALALLRGAPAQSDSNESTEAPADPSFIDMTPPTTRGGSWTAPFRREKTASATKEPTVDIFPELKGPLIAPKKSRTPSGARFEDGVFSNAYGSRSYKLYVPASYDGEATPLIVMLHGCTQSPDDFARGTRMNEIAEERNCLIAYPAQSQGANVSKCWNWFNATDQQSDQGEPSLIAGITRQIMEVYAVDPRRVYVAGLSAGGAAAAIMGANYPDLYAAIGVHSGLACGAASDLPSALAAMRQGSSRTIYFRKSVPTIVFHGDRDTTVSPINSEQVIAQAKGQSALYISEGTGRSSGGVFYRQTVYTGADRVPVFERWVLEGAGHAWAGGSSAGSFTDPKGPDASREMMRFFLLHRLAREQ